MGGTEGEHEVQAGSPPCQPVGRPAGACVPTYGICGSSSLSGESAGPGRAAAVGGDDYRLGCSTGDHLDHADGQTTSASCCGTQPRHDGSKNRSGDLMARPTMPCIYEAQNSSDARRLVAAQARLYSDAKVIFAVRVAVVIALATASAAVALVSPSLRTMIGGGGGVFVLVLSFVIGSVEKWVRMRAAATQELFDTRVFQLPWNSLHADRPPQHTVARAAQRYKGTRDKNWYSDTQGAHRPFDVLICQSTNFGWGARMHLLWAWTLVGITLGMVAVIAAGWRALNLSDTEGLLALVIPALGPLKEVGEQINANFDAARTKESAERKISEAWDKGLTGQHVSSTEDLRSIQDKILLVRQSNPYIPDWFDKAFHRSNEAAMHVTTADKIAQAARCGHAD